MSSEQGGKLGDAGEERKNAVLEDIMGREGNRIEVQEYGTGRSGPLSGGSSSAPRNDGCDASGGLRLPLGRSEPQPALREHPLPCEKMSILATFGHLVN